MNHYLYILLLEMMECNSCAKNYDAKVNSIGLVVLSSKIRRGAKREDVGEGGSGTGWRKIYGTICEM